MDSKLKLTSNLIVEKDEDAIQEESTKNNKVETLLDYMNTEEPFLDSSLINDHWLLRVGAGYDQQPTNSTDRNTRLPDGDRIATAIGFHYEPNKIVSFDAGWTHLFIEDSDVHNTAVSGQQITRVDGEEEAMANLYGLQMTLNMA